jgi:hypothetical protein
MEALKLLETYAEVDGKTRFYDAADEVPMDGVVRKDWREAVVDDKGEGRAHPVRAVRPGGPAGRDPAPRDLHRRGLALAQPGGRPPGDYEVTRTVHYAAIRRPQDPQAFIADLKRRMTAARTGCRQGSRTARRAGCG